MGLEEIHAQWVKEGLESGHAKPAKPGQWRAALRHGLMKNKRRQRDEKEASTRPVQDR